MRSKAVFVWKGELPAFDEDGADDEVGADEEAEVSEDPGEQWALRSCRPVVESLVAAARKAVPSVEIGDPDWEDTGWIFTIQEEGREYRVYVQWIPVKDREDCFAIDVSARRGFLASLFRKGSDDTEPACRILDRAVAAVPLVAEVQWLTPEQYDECLSSGRLPAARG